MTDYTNSALYSTSPDAMAAEEMGLPTRPARLDWDTTPTREEADASVMLQVLELLEYGRSQVIPQDQLLIIKFYVKKMIENN